MPIYAMLYWRSFIANAQKNKCMESALDAAIAAFGEADQGDSAQGAFDFDVADDCDTEPPGGG